MRPLAVGVVALAVLIGCGEIDQRHAAPRTSTTPAMPAPSAERTTSDAQPSPPLRAAGGPRVEVVVTGLEVPWDLAFLPDGRMLVTERQGRVRLVAADGSLRQEPVAEVDVSARGEGGLLGIDLDPEFADGQRFAYLYATVEEGTELQRWRVADDATVTRDAVVLDGIRAGSIHGSGRPRFGPDGNLYVLTGDAGQGELAQDPRSRNGKVLRLTPDQYRGTTDRPEILSVGHRNPQGLRRSVREPSR
jgi:glucose/arabinose dehydrogenase